MIRYPITQEAYVRHKWKLYKESWKNIHKPRPTIEKRTKRRKLRRPCLVRITGTHLFKAKNYFKESDIRRSFAITNKMVPIRYRSPIKVDDILHCSYFENITEALNKKVAEGFCATNPRFKPKEPNVTKENEKIDGFCNKKISDKKMISMCFLLYLTLEMMLYGPPLDYVLDQEFKSIDFPTKWHTYLKWANTPLHRTSQKTSADKRVESDHYNENDFSLISKIATMQHDSRAKKFDEKTRKVLSYATIMFLEKIIGHVQHDPGNDLELIKKLTNQALKGISAYPL